MKINTCEIEFTHKDKILFPKSDITKKDIIIYYDAIADYMLPYLKNRPLTMQRFPKGISDGGFFQKNASVYFPDWIETVKVKKEGGWVNHVVCNNKETLLYLVNQYVLTFHIALSKIDAIEYPDKLIFDLDPPTGNFNLVIKAAKTLRNFLENKLELKTFVMTTGSKGLHVVVPLKSDVHFDEVHEFAKEISQYIADKNPKEFTTATRKERREGRLYIDYLRNSYAQTSVSPFSIRAIENAPVATPLHWDELDDKTLNAQLWNIQNTFKRVEKVENPWKNFETYRKSIKKASKELKLLMKSSL